MRTFCVLLNPLQHLGWCKSTTKTNIWIKRSFCRIRTYYQFYWTIWAVSGWSWLNVTLDHQAVIGTIAAASASCWWRSSVTSYVTTAASLRLVSARGLIAAIFHFKCLQDLGQRWPEVAAAVRDSDSSREHAAESLHVEAPAASEHASCFSC